jgi:competence protein ComFC
LIKLPEIFKDFFNLLIPCKCLNCGINLHEYEDYVCKECLFKIPKTNFYKVTENPVSQVFWGRVNLEFAFSFYYFSKGSILQRLIHEIKYRKAKELAYELGKEFGKELKGSDFHKQIEMIIPVPLHPKKEKKRGYNQSDWIARGISDILNIQVSTQVLKRTSYSSSQTKKTRVQRWENVKDAFAIDDKLKIENKHVVLLDDVLTTGATLEACANQLLQVQGTKVSIISLAYTSD